MSRSRSAARFGFCLLLTGLAAAGTDPVVARRGNDQITLSQARALMAAQDQAARQRLTSDRTALRQYLRDVLLQRDILRAAQAQKWDRRPDIEAKVRQAHDQVVAQTFLADKATLPNGYPGEAEIQAAYAANKARLMQPRTDHLVQIFVPRTAGATDDEARQSLLAARSRILLGNATLPSAAATAGVRYLDMGWVAETQLVPDIRSAVAGLPVGDLSNPVCIENGCHVLQLVATKPAALAPLSAVRDDLIQALCRQKQSQLEAAYETSLLAKMPVALDEKELSLIAP